MENSYLSHLDAMLANAIWESIRNDKDDAVKVLEKLRQLEKLCRTNSRLKNKLRVALQWVTENVSFEEQIAEKLEKELQELGGPIAQTDPIQQTVPTDSNVVQTFQLQAVEDVLNSAELAPWHRVYGLELENFLTQITPIDGKYRLSAATTLIDWRTLPFYKSIALIRVHEPMWINSQMMIYYLTDHGNLFRLNGTSPPIHELNNKAPINLSAANVIDYLRFFLFFVRGNEGPFYMLESIEDPLLPKDMDSTCYSVLAKFARKAEVTKLNEDGSFLCDAVVYYSNAVFEAKFKVLTSGMIDMLSDTPIAGDLSSKIILPIA